MDFGKFITVTSLFLSFVQGPGIPSMGLCHGPLHEQIAHATELIENDPKNAGLYLGRGELYRHHGDWEKALDDYDRAIQLDSSLKTVDLARGKMWFEAGRYHKAKMALDTYLLKQPDNIEALVTRARVLMQLGQNQSAVVDWNHVLSRLSEPSPEYYIERAQALSAKDPEYLQEALMGIEEGMAVLGPIVTLQLYAIDLEIRLQNYTSALARLDEIARKSPRKEKWLFQRGNLLYKAGRMEAARQAYRDGLKAIEKLQEHRRNTNAIIELQKQLHEALKLLHQRNDVSQNQGMKP